MTQEHIYDRHAVELDSQLEEVMDSHRAEKEAQVQKEAEQLSTEPPALDRLAGPTTKDQVKAVGESTKSASDLVQEAMVRDRLREASAARFDLVESFTKEASAKGVLKALGRAAKTPQVREIAKGGVMGGAAGGALRGAAEHIARSGAAGAAKRVGVAGVGGAVSRMPKGTAAAALKGGPARRAATSRVRASFSGVDAIDAEASTITSRTGVISSR